MKFFNNSLIGLTSLIIGLILSSCHLSTNTSKLPNIALIMANDMGYYRPHPPMVTPKKYFDMHPLASVQLPHVPENDREDIPEVAFELKDDAFNFIVESNGKNYTQAYYAAVSFVDAQVGLLIDALKRNNLYDNSIIIFVGDQGFHLGEHGHWHKTTLFEEGTNVPLILAGKGIINTGKISNSITELVDVYPTLTELLGLEKPHEMPGKSLRGILTGNAKKDSTVALTAVRQAGGISMRTNRYRLTSWTINGEKVYEL
jgi:iduronate 2-sulfatase